MYWSKFKKVATHKEYRIDNSRIEFYWNMLRINVCVWILVNLVKNLNIRENRICVTFRSFLSFVSMIHWTGVWSITYQNLIFQLLIAFWNLLFRSLFRKVTLDSIFDIPNNNFEFCLNCLKSLSKVFCRLSCTIFKKCRFILLAERHNSIFPVENIWNILIER